MPGQKSIYETFLVCTIYMYVYNNSTKSAFLETEISATKWKSKRRMEGWNTGFRILLFEEEKKVTLSFLQKSSGSRIWASDEHLADPDSYYAQFNRQNFESL
jgi:hypothetical protein